MEQMVCSLARGAGAGTAILARSAGLTRELATEAMTAITTWSPPGEGTQDWSVLLSLPLKGSLPGTPGRIYLAARVRRGADARLLVHALFLGQDDYAAFGYNPYRLQAEALFLEAWAPGLILERIERRPNSFAALVSPLPDTRDAGLLDEALRAYFATGRLVMPLAAPEPEAERYFALFIECLPAYMRRELTFASFAPGGMAAQSAGAACMPDGSFQAWRGSLLSAVRRPLPSELEDYVATVRRHVGAADLMSLAAVGRALDHAPTRRAAGEPRPGTLSATITRSAEPPPESPALRRARPDIRAAAVAEEAVPQRARLGAAPVRDHAGRRGAGRGLWLALAALALIGIGVVFHLPGRGPAGADAPAPAAAGPVAPAAVRPAPGQAREPERVALDADAPPPAARLDGVIDIGALYAAELEAFRRQTEAPGAETRRLQAGEQARAALGQRGGVDLRRQTLEYLAEAEGDVGPGTSPVQEVDRARRLQGTGRQIASELRRLALALYAFGRGEPWDDLGRLGPGPVTVRWDSVRRQDPERLAAAETGLAITGLAGRVDVARRQAELRGRLAARLGQSRRDEEWLPALQQTLKELDEVALSPGLGAWRDAARELAALKQVEDAAGFGALAGAADWSREGIPAPVQTAVVALRATLAAAGTGHEPPLARAILDLHDNLARARDIVAAAGAPDELVRLFATLDASAALRFDPATYADHVDRARLQAVRTLLGQGRAPDAIPLSLFPRENRQALIAFLQLEQARVGGAAWRELAAVTPVPLLARLATARAAEPEPVPSVADSPFDLDFQRLALAAARLAAEAQRGRDWTAPLIGVRAQLDTFRALHPDRPSLSADHREKLARIAALAAALDAPLGLPLAAVSVSLAGDQLGAGAEIVVELIAAGGEDGYRTPAILLARDAAGRWTGARELTGELRLRPARPLEARITGVADGRTLAVVHYDASAAAPGALARAMPASPPDGGAVVGTMVFEVPGWFWRRLVVPDLRQPIAAAAGR